MSTCARCPRPPCSAEPDRYLVHQPYKARSDGELQAQWAAMEAVQQTGLARSIGVSCFTEAHLRTVLATARVVPAVNQVELHLHLQRHALLALHKAHGIATAAYSALTPLKPPASAGGGTSPCAPLLGALAKKYAVDDAAICLRWCIDQDTVAVTTTAHASRMVDYLRVGAFKLTPAELRELNELGQQRIMRRWFADRFAADDAS